MFLVKWNDLSEKVVYRRFTEIYEFHVSPPGTHRLGQGKKEGECHLKLHQSKHGSKEAPGSSPSISSAP